MKELEIVTPVLFKSFSELEMDDTYFDLHNDYDCDSVILSKNRELILSFKSNDKKVKILFKDCTLNFVSLTFGDVKEDITTIDTIYRGRYEDGSVLRAVTDDFRYYYYIEFYSGYKIELFARSVFLETRKP